MSGEESLTVRLPGDLKQALAEAAAKEERTASQLVRLILNGWWKRHKRAKSKVGHCPKPHTLNR